MGIRLVDKNLKEIKVGQKLQDIEGIYDVIEYQEDLAIASDKSIWMLNQFRYQTTMDGTDMLYVFVDFEVMED